MGKKSSDRAKSGDGPREARSGCTRVGVQDVWTAAMMEDAKALKMDKELATKLDRALTMTYPKTKPTERAAEVLRDMERGAPAGGAIERLTKNMNASHCDQVRAVACMVRFFRRVTASATSKQARHQAAAMQHWIKSSQRDRSRPGLYQQQAQKASALIQKGEAPRRRWGKKPRKGSEEAMRRVSDPQARQWLREQEARPGITDRKQEAPARPQKQQQQPKQRQARRPDPFQLKKAGYMTILKTDGTKPRRKTIRQMLKEAEKINLRENWKIDTPPHEKRLLTANGLTNGAKTVLANPKAVAQKARRGPAESMQSAAVDGGVAHTMCAGPATWPVVCGKGECRRIGIGEAMALQGAGSKDIPDSTRRAMEARIGSLTAASTAYKAVGQAQYVEAQARVWTAAIERTEPKHRPNGEVLLAAHCAGAFMGGMAGLGTALQRRQKEGATDMEPNPKLVFASEEQLVYRNAIREVHPTAQLAAKSETSTELMLECTPDALDYGPPCKPFSRQGKRSEEEARRAVDGMVETLQPIAKKKNLKTLPKWIVIENVEDFGRYFPQEWERWNVFIDSLPYFASVQTIDPAKDLGIDISRARMFYLLIRQDVYSKRHAKEAAKYRGGAKISPRKGIAKRR